MAQIGTKDAVRIDIPSNDTKKAPYLFGVNLNNFSSPVRFIICTIAVFIFYVIYGYYLEYIFHIEGAHEIEWFITVVYFAFFSILSFIQLLISGEVIRTQVPLHLYMLVALVTLGTMCFSNASMAYLNFATQVIFKSCKLIPVMIGSVILLGKRYNFAQVLACFLMCFGLIWFTLADSTVQPHFSLLGVFLVCMALCCDAVLGNVQEVVLTHNKEPSARLVFYTHIIGLVLLSIILMCFGTFFSGLQFMYANLNEVMPKMFAMSLSGFFGVQAVLALVSQYGALAAVTVTTARKAVSIVLSFLFFTKPFTIQYLYGGLLVVLGIYLSLLGKNKDSAVTKRLNSCYQRVLDSLADAVAPVVSAVNKKQSLTGVIYTYSFKLHNYYRRVMGVKPPHQFSFDV